MKKEVIKLTKIIIFALLLTTGISFAQQVWTNPTSFPAMSNVFAPINAWFPGASLPAQNKNAGLSVTSGPNDPTGFPAMYVAGGDADFFDKTIIEDSVPFAGPKDLSVASKATVGGNNFNETLNVSNGTMRIRSLAHNTTGATRPLPNKMKVCSDTFGKLILCSFGEPNHGFKVFDSTVIGWRPPLGVDKIIFEAWGGGGGGGGGGGTDVSGCSSPCVRTAGGGQGGGSGSYGLSQVIPVSASTTFDISVGGPAGGGASGNAASPGGDGYTGNNALVKDNDAGVANSGIIVRGQGGGGGGHGDGNGCGTHVYSNAGIDSAGYGAGTYYLSVSGNQGAASTNCDGNQGGTGGSGIAPTSQTAVNAAIANFGGVLVAPGATSVGALVGTVSFAVVTATLGTLITNPVIAIPLAYSIFSSGGGANGNNGGSFNGVQGSGAGGGGAVSNGRDLSGWGGDAQPHDGGYGGAGGSSLVRAVW